MDAASSASTTSASNGATGLPEASASTSKWHWLALLAVAAFAFLVVFYELGDFRALGSHEVYAVVPAREMLESGNWTVPTYGGLPRLEKPPLAYWIIAASTRALGELNTFTARFPAAVSTLLLALLIGCWVGRWFGRTAGIVAAVVQVTSMYALIYARKAEIDMLLCLLTTSALCLVGSQNPAESRGRAFLRWTAIYALLALSWMAKFHYGLAMVLGPCVVFYLVQKRYRDLRQLANPLGLAMLAAAIFVWPALLLRAVPEAASVWQEETVGRAVGFLGRKPIWFYLPQILWMALPWTGLILQAIPSSFRRAWRRPGPREVHFGLPLWRAGDARDRFMWVWFLVVFAIITISADKHKHYAIAAMPMLSMLAGQQAAVIRRRAREGRRIVSPAMAIATCVLGIVSGVGLVLFVPGNWPELAAPTYIVSAVLAIGVCAIAWLLVKKKPTAAWCTCLVVFLGCYIPAIGWMVPARDRWQVIANFADDVRGALPARQQDVAVYQMGMHAVVCYLDSPVHRLESLRDVKVELAQRGSLNVVTYEGKVGELRLAGPARVMRHLPAGKETTGFNTPSLVLVKLTPSRPRHPIAAH